MRPFVAAAILLRLLFLWPQSIATTSDPNELYNLNSDRDSDQLTRPDCGYNSCPQLAANKLNVHIIAHTHDDVGWLKTVDQYYYGSNKQNSQVGVQFILDSIVPQLLMDKSKRFIYVEMSFFSKWWREQDEPMRVAVRKLVNEGRLEFINGGWCMNDEATVTYRSTIEQMTLGLKFLNDSFGFCARPKVGWQIDPFGHTSEQASLFAQFGFDGMYFTRISYRDKLARTEEKKLDVMWHADRALSGQSGSIFTNIFRDGYDAPNGFCFDSYCKDDVIVDNKNSYEYNLDRKGQEMIRYIRTYGQSKQTNNLLIPMGGDFQYSAAGQNFKSLDKLIKYIRVNAADIHIFYSTPSCYQYALHSSVRQKALKLPEKFDDFMPYDSGPTVWWSGYFASRPSVKLIERETANLLQSMRMVSLGNLIRLGPTRNWVSETRAHETKCLMPLWEILGDLQHHDAVTGTEKQHVADDYVRRVEDARSLCANFVGSLNRARLNETLRKSSKFDQLRESAKRLRLDPVYLENTVFCPLLNISECDPIESDVDPRRYPTFLNATTSKSARLQTGPKSSTRTVPSELETKSILVTVYNPLARPISNLDVRLPCNGRCNLERVHVVQVATNESLQLYRLPLLPGVAKLSFRNAQTNQEVLFYASVPALGSAAFVLTDSNQDELIDEDSALDSILITDESSQQAESSKAVPKNRRIRKAAGGQYTYFQMAAGSSNSDSDGSFSRVKREHTNSAQQSGGAASDADRVIIKFDLETGMIVGLKRATDGSFLQISQKFGYYFPADGHPPGAYIFRPNSTEPHLFEKPLSFKMIKRQNGALIEIQQKWADWIWQTIRVDARKNYIEFDYVVGPIPLVDQAKTGREVVTRYMTNMANDNIFFTDSNARQLLARQKWNTSYAAELGGSFYPVVSTMLVRNTAAGAAANNKSAEAVAVLVDRAQAATSLNQGDLEFLIHRRQTLDDRFGVGEPLNEPGEDGCGLVTRGRHRLFLKFRTGHKQEAGDETRSSSSPSSKLKKGPKIVKLPAATADANSQDDETERPNSPNDAPLAPYLVHDQLLDDLKLESIKFALEPLLTFDRLRVSGAEFVEMLAANGNANGLKQADRSLLNVSLPANVHLLTLQPWNLRPNELLIRLENLDNPLVVHPQPNPRAYTSILNSYRMVASQEVETLDACVNYRRSSLVEANVEFLLKRLRITALTELNLGANSRLKDDTRLDWSDETERGNRCDIDSGSARPNSIKLAPRQIRTFLATFEFI